MFLGALLILGLSLPTMAKDTTSSKKEMPMMSTEQRQKMANAHQQMADCLRSDKTMGECHEQMRNACLGAGDKGSCMGMGKGMGMMGGRHGDHGKVESSKEKDDKE